jgi:hypothetical protein
LTEIDRKERILGTKSGDKRKCLPVTVSRLILFTTVIQEKHNDKDLLQASKHEKLYLIHASAM